MRIDTTKLGASLLAAGPILIQLGGSKQTWWLGLVFTVIGPFLMSLRASHSKPRS